MVISQLARERARETAYLSIYGETGGSDHEGGRRDHMEGVYEGTRTRHPGEITLQGIHALGIPCISNLAKEESEVAPKSRMLQMKARVQLDASHVSRCVTARREKVSRYIRVSNELLRHARSDYLLYACEFLSTLRENWSRFLRVLEFYSWVIGGSVADLGVGARSAAAAPFRLLRVLEVDRGEGRRLTRRIRRSWFDEAKLQRFGQQAGSSMINWNKIWDWVHSMFEE